jgi:hypothetical protein
MNVSMEMQLMSVSRYLATSPVKESRIKHESGADGAAAKTGVHHTPAVFVAL